MNITDFYQNTTNVIEEKPKQIALQHFFVDGLQIEFSYTAKSIQIKPNCWLFSQRRAKAFGFFSCSIDQLVTIMNNVPEMERKFYVALFWPNRPFYLDCDLKFILVPNNVENIDRFVHKIEDQFILEIQIQIKELFEISNNDIKIWTASRHNFKQVKVSLHIVVPKIIFKDLSTLIEHVCSLKKLITQSQTEWSAYFSEAIDLSVYKYFQLWRLPETIVNSRKSKLHLRDKQCSDSLLNSLRINFLCDNTLSASILWEKFQGSSHVIDNTLQYVDNIKDICDYIPAMKLSNLSFINSRWIYSNTKSTAIYKEHFFFLEQQCCNEFKHCSQLNQLVIICKHASGVQWYQIHCSYCSKSQFHTLCATVKRPWSFRNLDLGLDVINRIDGIIEQNIIEHKLILPKCHQFIFNDNSVEYHSFNNIVLTISLQKVIQCGFCRQKKSDLKLQVRDLHHKWVMQGFAEIVIFCNICQKYIT